MANFYGKYFGIFGGGGGGGGSSTTPFQETPSGTVNGSNVTFTLSHIPSAAASVVLFLSGRALIQGVGNDYTITGTVITMTVAPNFGQGLYASYSY